MATAQPLTPNSGDFLTFSMALCEKIMISPTGPHLLHISRQESRWFSIYNSLLFITF